MFTLNMNEKRVSAVEVILCVKSLKDVPAKKQYRNLRLRGIH